MNKAKALRKEIDEILLKPMPWGAMVTDRAKVALSQAANTMELMSDTIWELQNRLKYFDTIKHDTKLERNIEILRRYESGESPTKLSREFGTTRQRIYRICFMTKRYLDGTQAKRISRDSDQDAPRETISG